MHFARRLTDAHPECAVWATQDHGCGFIVTTCVLNIQTNRLAVRRAVPISVISKLMIISINVLIYDIPIVKCKSKQMYY